MVRGWRARIVPARVQGPGQPKHSTGVAAIVGEGLQLETVRAVPAAGFHDGAGLTRAEATVAHALAGPSMSDFVVLIAADEPEQLVPDLSQRFSEAIAHYFE